MLVNSWFSELKPEFHIIFIAGIILFALVIIILIRVLKMSKEIANKTLKITEEILDEKGKPITIIKIINTGYIDNEINEIGILYRDRKYPLIQEKIDLKARSKYELMIDHDKLRSLIRLNDSKMKRLKIYYENNIGLLISISSRKTRKEINLALKNESEDLENKNDLPKENDSLNDEVYDNIIVENHEEPEVQKMENDYEEEIKPEEDFEIPKLDESIEDKQNEEENE